MAKPPGPPSPPSAAASASAAAAAERNLRLVRVTGDGRCMFRSLALGLSAEKGRSVGPQEEERDADLLRMAVAGEASRANRIAHSGGGGEMRSLFLARFARYGGPLCPLRWPALPATQFFPPAAPFPEISAPYSSFRTEAMCTKAVERQKHPEALMAINAEGGLQQYCPKGEGSATVVSFFWGLSRALNE